MEVSQEKLDAIISFFKVTNLIILFFIQWSFFEA